MTWDCDKNNSRGDIIDDIITDNTNDGSYTYLHLAAGTFTAINLSLCSSNIRMEIGFMVELDSRFLLFKQIGVSLPDALPV